MKALPSSDVQPDPIALELARSLKMPGVGAAIAPALARVEKALSARLDQPQAWEPLPLDSLGFIPPGDIKSCWVFVLRTGAVFGAERHPNSHQRTVALSGTALFELFTGGSWRPSPIEGGSAISIPPSVWHRIQIGPQNFVSVSFHTVPADRLVEETPLGEDLTITKQRLYHA